MSVTTGKIMQAYRSKMGLTQESVGEFLGIKREQLSYYENDSREAPLEILEKLANLYGIDLADFFEEDEIQFKSNVALAFKASELQSKDLEVIAEFRKIVRNYFKIIDLEKKL